MIMIMIITIIAIVMIIITYDHITIGATISCHWANGDPSNPTVPFAAKLS